MKVIDFFDDFYKKSLRVKQNNYFTRLLFVIFLIFILIVFLFNSFFALLFFVPTALYSTLLGTIIINHYIVNNNFNLNLFKTYYLKDFFANSNRKMLKKDFKTFSKLMKKHSLNNDVGICEIENYAQRHYFKKLNLPTKISIVLGVFTAILTAVQMINNSIVKVLALLLAVVLGIIVYLYSPIFSSLWAIFSKKIDEEDLKLLLSDYKIQSQIKDRVE